MALKPFYFLVLIMFNTSIQLSLTEAPYEPPKDVLFVIDGSGSVKPANFDKLRVFLKAIVDGFDNQTNVALIQFSSRQLTKVEFNLDTYNNKEDIKQAIDNMVYQRKYTYTGYAMKLAREEVFNGLGGDRPDAENVLLLFTDGEAADPHIARAQSTSLKTNGAHVMSVGFGPKKSVEKFKDELEVMASSTDKDVFVKGFEDLDEINRRLVEVTEPKSQSADQCATKPCRNGGKCQHTEDSYICICTDEYKGRNCEKTKGPCEQKPCLHGGACIEGASYDNGFTCICDDKYYGKLCEKKKEVCRTKNADVLFILDGSRSIKNSDFSKMKTFVIELAYRFNISKDQTKIAVVQFSEAVRTEFYLYEYFNMKSIATKIKSVRQLDGGATNTDEALALASTEIFKRYRGGREDVRNVIILLTDGEANNPDRAKEEATKLKDADVSIITIGVGKGEVEEPLQNFLKDIASSPEYLFKSSFLKLDTIVNGVTKAACENLRNN